MYYSGGMKVGPAGRYNDNQSHKVEIELINAITDVLLFVRKC